MELNEIARQLSKQAIINNKAIDTPLMKETLANLGLTVAQVNKVILSACNLVAQDKKADNRANKLTRKNVKTHVINEDESGNTRKKSLIPVLSEKSAKALTTRKAIRAKIMRGEVPKRELDKLDAWHGTKVQVTKAEFSTNVKGKEKRYNVSKAPTNQINTQNFSN